MKKEHILIIVLIIIIGFLCYSQFVNNTNDNKQYVVVGHSKFIIPEGYKIGHDQNHAKNLSNGTNSIFLLENNGTDINKYINGYKDYFNNSVVIEKLRVGDYEVYKLTPPNNSNTHHYYFVKDKRVYDIYIWDGNPNIDSEVNTILSNK